MLSIPVIYVSHSIEEVIRLCDYLLVMERGRIIAAGGIQDVLLRADLPLLGGEDGGLFTLDEAAIRETLEHLATTKATRDEARMVAEKIRASFEAPIAVEGREVYVTPSIGITFYPLDDGTTEALLRNARKILDLTKGTDRAN